MAHSATLRRSERARPTRAAYDVRDLMALTGRSRNWLYEAVANGTFGRPIRAGRSVLVRRDAVEAWLRGEDVVATAPSHADR
jgi:predicted DNA-binding transcriptional regulator AlpA